jgi:lipopolysaccharide/colanic/teichoic acid biosynthesis glycosyltransferase
MNENAMFAEFPSTVWLRDLEETNAAAIFPPATEDTVPGAIPWMDPVKRGVDVVVSLLGIVMTLPLWGLIALAVKATSRGPVFFSQERAGLHGRPFRMFKFRSMVVDAEAQLKKWVNIEDLAEPVYKLKDDPRVTRVGRFLRRFGLDELPQLINVLRGEMSLVGPRPEVVALAERYDAEQRRRLLVKPGITGYQQIHNRGMPDMAARLEYDFYYLHNRSTLLDLWILAMTFAVISSGEEITY